MDWLANNWGWLFVIALLVSFGLAFLAWKMRGTIIVATALSVAKAGLKKFLSRRHETRDEEGDNRDRGKDPYHDRVITDRNRFGRMLCAIVYSALILLTPPILLLWLLPWTGEALTVLIWAAGLGVGVWLLGQTFHFITLYVPIVQGLVTQDMFFGNRVVYGPGLHPRYPWEEIHKESNVSLKTVTKVLTGKRFPVKDDEVEVELTYQWAARLRDLAAFIGVAPSTIEEGFDSLFENLLAEKLAGLTVDEAATEEVMEQCNSELQDLYETDAGYKNSIGRHKKEKLTLEDQYGIDLKVVRIERITPSKEVLEARAAAAESVALHKRIAKELGYEDEKELFAALKSGELNRKEYEKARDTFLIMSEEISKNINEFVIPGLPEFAQAFGAALGSKLAEGKKGDRG